MNTSSTESVDRFGFDLTSFWMNAQGELLEIAEMETSHIKNCIRMLITFLSEEVDEESDSPRLLSLTAMFNELLIRSSGVSNIPLNTSSDSEFLTNDDFLMFGNSLWGI